jgi:hypothetical protein
MNEFEELDRDKILMEQPTLPVVLGEKCVEC